MTPTMIKMFLLLMSLGYGTAFNPIKNFSFESVTNGQADNWAPQYGGYTVTTGIVPAWDGQRVLTLAQPATPTGQLGAYQRVTINQTIAKPVKIFARVRGQGIQDLPTDKYGASLYCRIQHSDGSMDYCPTTMKTKMVGTFDWAQVGFNTANFVNGTKPIVWIEMIPMMGQVAGTAYFDAVRVEEHEIHSTGMVTLMFDDGFATNHTEALPVLNSYGVRGSAAIVTSYIGTPGYMSILQVKDLVSNGWEIVSHSMRHKDMTTLTPVEMEDEFYWARRWFNDNGFMNIRHFALPFGAYNGLVNRTGQIYHLSLRSTDRGYNPAGTYPYNVWIQEVDSNNTTQEVQGWIDTARTSKRWLVLVFHEIKNANQMPVGTIYYTTPSTFSTIVGMVANSGMPVVTYDTGFISFFN